MEYWNTGILEYWAKHRKHFMMFVGFSYNSTIPSFQHSIFPNDKKE
jgi:hypothetical protein